MPPHCEKCGGKRRLIQRPDDREEVIGKRLEVFEAQTKPLIKHYQGTACCASSTRMREVQPVFKSIQRAVVRAGRPSAASIEGSQQLSPISARRHPDNAWVVRAPIASALSSPRGARISALTSSSARAHRRPAPTDR